MARTAYVYVSGSLRNDVVNFGAGQRGGPLGLHPRLSRFQQRRGGRRSPRHAADVKHEDSGTRQFGGH
jgi:hypothetical protein